MSLKESCWHCFDTWCHFTWQTTGLLLDSFTNKQETFPWIQKNGALRNKKFLRSDRKTRKINQNYWQFWGLYRWWSSSSRKRSFGWEFQKVCQLPTKFNFAFKVLTFLHQNVKIQFSLIFLVLTLLSAEYCSTKDTRATNGTDNLQIWKILTNTVTKEWIYYLSFFYEVVIWIQ